MNPMTQKIKTKKTCSPIQPYVLTSGSTGDGKLRVSCQEHTVPVPYPLGYGVICTTNLGNSTKIYHLFKKTKKLVTN
jgi:hypothetical protein